MLQQQLFPDTVIIMSVDVTEVQKRLLPTYLEKWRERRNHRKAQQKLLHDLRKKNRVSKLLNNYSIFQLYYEALVVLSSQKSSVHCENIGHNYLNVFGTGGENCQEKS